MKSGAKHEWIDINEERVVHSSIHKTNGKTKVIEAQSTYLNRDNKVAEVLEEILCVETNNTCLIWLCNIGKNTIYHADEHAVLVLKQS